MPNAKTERERKQNISCFRFETGDTHRSSRLDETTNDRSDRRTSEGHERKERQSLSTMINLPNIGEQSSGIRQRCGGEATAQEPEDEDRAGVPGQGTTDLKSGVEDEGDDEDWTTTI